MSGRDSSALQGAPCEKTVIRYNSRRKKIRGEDQSHMLGRTHFFIGITTALAIFEPSSLPILVAGTGAAAMGGILPDIDAGTSGASRETEKIIGVCTAAVSLIILADYFFHIGIYQSLMSRSSTSRVIAGIAAFLLLCVIGRRTHHRSFMHSFAAMILFCLCVNVIFPQITCYFAAGYLSHLLTDLLNRQWELLLWPSKRGFSLKMFRSDGVVNWLMFVAFMCTSVYLILVFSPLKPLADAITAGIKPKLAAAVTAAIKPKLAAAVTAAIRGKMSGGSLPGSSFIWQQVKT